MSDIPESLLQTAETDVGSDEPQRWAAGVILSQLAVELAVEQTLSARMASQNKRMKKLRGYNLSNDEQRDTFERYAELLIPAATADSLKWSAGVRNGAVHRGKLPSHDDAKNAVATNEKFVAWLRSTLS